VSGTTDTGAAGAPGTQAMGADDRVGADNAGRDDERSRLRRRDRGKDDAWGRALLKQAPYGYFATVGGTPKSSRFSIRNQGFRSTSSRLCADSVCVSGGFNR